MKLIFNNKKELIINYFSAADGQMLIKTDFAEQTELENLFKDFLGTKIITYKDDKEEKQYSNYTNFDSITRNIRTNEYTIIMSLDGSDFTSQIEALKSIANKNIDLLKTMQNTVNEITVLSEKQGQKMQEIDGSDFTSQIEALKSIANKNIDLLKTMQNTVNEITVLSEKQGQKMQEIQGFLKTVNDEIGTGKENLTNMTSEIETLQTSDTTIKENVNSANEQITSLQLAMVEVYESMNVSK